MPKNGQQCTGVHRVSLTALSAFPTALFLVLIFALSFFTFGCTTDDDNDDNNDVSYCTQDFCEAWCLENYWTDGWDAGLKPWAKREAVCLSTGCSCEESLCNPDNCVKWCQTEEGKSSGHCEIFSCVCDD